MVKDVDYVIDQVHDWEDYRGDFADDWQKANEAEHGYERVAFIEFIEEAI